MLKADLNYASIRWLLPAVALLLWSATGATAACDPPFNIQVSGATLTSLTVDWTVQNAPPETAWDVTALPYDAPPPLPGDTPTHPLVFAHPTTLGGLQAGTAYRIYVRARCGTPGAWTIAPATGITRLDGTNSCGIDLPIPNNDCHVYELEVSGQGGTALGTDVTLDRVGLIVAHEWDSDLDMHLIAPDGTRVRLAADNGSGQDNYGDPTDPTCTQRTTFFAPDRPGACNLPSIEAGSPPFIGDFLPEESLAAFRTGGNPNGIWQLEICDDAPDHTGSLRHVQLLFDATGCVAPADVVVVAADSTTLVLDWRLGSNCTGTIAEYGPPGFVPGTGLSPGTQGNVVVLNCPTATITGLAPNTEYELYLRSLCGNDYTLNSCVVRAATTCSPGAPAVAATFDDAVLCAPVCGVACPLDGPWQNSTQDQFDWVVHNDSTPSANTGPPAGAGGSGRYLYLESSAPTCQNGRRAVLVSDCFDVRSRADGCDFSFDYHLFGNAVNSLRLEVTNDGGLNWTLLYLLSGNQGDRWQRAYVGLGNYDNQTVRLRFTGRGGGNAAGDIGLDNLLLYGGSYGGPATTFYRDNDGDGYGVDNLTVQSCGTQPPAGFAALAGDCRDDNFGGQFINPGVAEIGCDGVDNNCNGIADDAALPGPAVSGATVCSGATATLSGNPSSGFGDLYWYTAPTDTDAFFVGNTYSYTPAVSGAGRIDTFYVAERVVFNAIELCASTELSVVTVTVLPQPAISIDHVAEVCAGAFVDLSGIDLQQSGAPFDSLRFYAGPTTTAVRLYDPIYVPTTDGIVTFEVSNAAGCTDTAQLSIRLRPTPQPFITGADTLCRGATGVLSVSTPAFSTDSLTYAWNTGDTSAQLVVSGPLSGAAQAYSVTVTAPNGCSASANTAVTAAPEISTVNRQISAVSNCNGANGNIALEVIGGQPPFVYTWSGPVSGSALGGASYTITDLPQGTYTLSISDGSPFGCAVQLPNNVVSGPSAVIEQVAPTLPGCAAGTDGCLEVQFSGGNPTFAWSNGGTAAQICGLVSGTYSVTVTEGACITVLDNLQLDAPAPLAANTDLAAPSCTGAADGSIVVSASGGTAPYAVQWADGISAALRTDLSAGTYSPTLTDANGCAFALDSLVIADPAPLRLDTLRLEAVRCFGDSNGSVQVIGTGGTPPYTYRWENDNTGPLRQNLSAGTYSVTVTDVGACTYATAVTISQPDELSVTLIADAPTCIGVNDGTITAVVAGGSPDYQLRWNDDDTIRVVRTALSPGSYALTITDGQGCTTDTATTLTAPEALSLQLAAAAPTCTGVADGQIELSVSGGTGSYTYFRDSLPGTSSNLFTALSGGFYRFRAVDTNGCTVVDSFALVADEPFNFTFSPLSPACFGENTGQILVQPAGGTPNYSFAWSNGAATEDLSQVAAGSYQLSVTDAVGCTFVSDTLVLAAAEPLTVVVNSVDSLGCGNAAVGQIDVSVTGGAGGYSYQWNTGATDQNLTGLGAGSYTLQVRDAANCFAFSETVVLTEYPPLAFTYNEADNPNDPCSATTIDSIILLPLAGQGPFSYAWNDGDTVAIRTQLPSGEYSVTITDARGCTDVVAPIKIPDFVPNLTVDLVAPPDTLGFCTAAYTLHAVINGGSAPYQYNWSMGQVNNAWPSDTVPGTVSESGLYRVTITDANGCQSITPDVAVNFAQPLQLAYTIDPIPCFGGENGGIELTVVAGSGPYTYTWLNAAGDTIAAQEDLPDQLAAGDYRVIVTDARDCTASSPLLTIAPPPAPLMLDQGIQTDPVDCFDGDNGSLSAQPTGGTPPYQYTWSKLPPGADPVVVGTGPELLFQAAGDYRLRIVDANDCLFVSAPVTLEQPESLLRFDSVAISATNCDQTTDGSIEVFVGGGWGDYQYTWFAFPAATDSLVTGVAPGVYQVEVADAEGCRRISPFYTVLPGDTVTVGVATQAPTPSGSDGQISLTPGGGTAPYQYIWSDAATDSVRTELPAGTYQVTVTDAAGCTTTVEILLEAATTVTGTSFLRQYSLGPNPTDGRCTVRWEATRAVSGELLLVDIFGRVLQTRKVDSLPKGRLELDLRAYPAGSYRVILRHRNGQYATLPLVRH